MARKIQYRAVSVDRVGPEFLETGKTLAVPVEALMEPTGTYGEPLRALLMAHGVHVFMLSPKRSGRSRAQVTERARIDERGWPPHLLMARITRSPIQLRHAPPCTALHAFGPMAR